MHLPNCRCVELLKALALRHTHLDELRIQTFHVREDQQVLYRCVVAHVAVKAGIGVPPLLRGLTE